MFKNKIKKALYEGKPCFGTFICTNSTDIVEIFGLVGFDFVIIDTEHGYMSPETSRGLIRAAEVTGMTPIIRVTENSEASILRSLDIGAHGVQVPHVNNVEEAKLTIQYSKYYPEGMRGIATARSSNYWLVPIEDYLRQENEETLVILHCETEEGLNDLENIAQIPGIDVIFLGPFDMSQSMGIPGQTDHPRIKAALERVLHVCKKYNKIAGIYCESAETAKRMADAGFLFLPISMDGALISSTLQNVITTVKGTN